MLFSTYSHKNLQLEINILHIRTIKTIEADFMGNLIKLSRKKTVKFFLVSQNRSSKTNSSKPKRPSEKQTRTIYHSSY